MNYAALQHVRAGAARVGGNAARVAGASAGARVTNTFHEVWRFAKILGEHQ